MRLWCVLVFCFCRFISNLCGESPSGKPVIYPSASEHVLQPGDNLTCIATGGNPQPDELHFHCVNPSLPDGNDENNATHMSSVLTVHRVLSTLKNVRCTCTAVWRGNVTLPDVSTVAVYNVEDLPEGHYNPLGLVVGVLGLPVFALLIVFIAVTRRRLQGNTLFTNLRRRWNKRKSDASQSSSSDDSDSDLYVLPDDEPTSQPRGGVPLLCHQDVEEGEGEMDGSHAACPCPNAYEPMQTKAQDDNDAYTDLYTQSEETDDVYQNCSAVELVDEGSVDDDDDDDDDYIPMNVAEC